MALNDFLFSGDNSWADDDFELPTTCMYRYTLDDAPNRSDLSRQPYNREPIQEEPLPTEPPYNVTIFNIPYNITKEDLSAHFSSLSVESTRLISNKIKNTPPHMAIVTLTDLENLTQALKLSGTEINGRTIRISVSTKRKQEDERDDRDWRTDRVDRDDFRNSQRSQEPSSQADSNSSWRQTANAPNLDRGDFNRNSYRSREYSREDAPEQQTQADLDDKWRNHKNPAPVGNQSFSRNGSGVRNNDSYAGDRPRNPGYEPRFDSGANRESSWRSRAEQQAPPPIRGADDFKPYERTPSERKEQPIPHSAADKNNQWRRHDNPKPVESKPEAEDTKQTSKSEAATDNNTNTLPNIKPGDNMHYYKKDSIENSQKTSTREAVKNPSVADKESSWRRKESVPNPTEQAKNLESQNKRDFRSNSNAKVEVNSVGSWRSSAQRTSYSEAKTFKKEPLQETQNEAPNNAETSNVANEKKGQDSTTANQKKGQDSTTANQKKGQDSTTANQRPEANSISDNQDRSIETGKTSRQGSDHRQSKNDADQSNSWRSRGATERRTSVESKEARSKKTDKIPKEGSNKNTYKPRDQSKSQHSSESGETYNEKKKLSQRAIETQVDQDGWSVIPTKTKHNRR
ncbi:hypothetical protein BB561_003839 [Smittium simulii]|uniref:RRM domain-containing protein n=1 Tax=Smittium simulii TaxID=133385 RepID=A0A2T9YJC2_9FUNG|nr:hypothetical protein BB561_003839 [Smittium simulii]